MDSGVVIEWERLSIQGTPLNHYVARILEPFVSEDFATVLAKNGRWRIYWYPARQTFQPVTAQMEVGTLAKAQYRVERWARHHATTLKRQAQRVRSELSTFEQRRL